MLIFFRVFIFLLLTVFVHNIFYVPSFKSIDKPVSKHVLLQDSLPALNLDEIKWQFSAEKTLAFTDELLLNMPQTSFSMHGKHLEIKNTHHSEKKWLEAINNMLLVADKYRLRLDVISCHFSQTKLALSSICVFAPKFSY